MILAYHTSQSKLCGLPERYCIVNYALMDQVLQVLDFCAELDPVARRFAQILSAHKGTLQPPSYTRGPGTADAIYDQSCEEKPPSSEISILLLATPPADTLLQQTSADILKQLCNPYMGSDEVSPCAIDCQSRLPPMASQAPELPSHRSYERFTADILNGEDGYFVGSHQPSWWMTQRSSSVYLQGATKLGVL